MRRRERNTLILAVLALFVLGGSVATAKPRKKRLTMPELVELARRTGFDDPEFAATIAMRESGGDPSTINDTRGRTDLPKGTTNEWSFGLWQINKLAWPQYAQRDLLDPETNAATALEIQRKSGWAPWSTAKTPTAPPPATPPPEPTVTPVGPADEAP